MKIKKEIIKSLLKENFKDLCKNLLFEDWQKISRYRCISEMRDYFNTAKSDKAEIVLFPFDKPNNERKIKLESISNLGYQLTSLKDNNRKKAEESSNNWANPSNADNKNNLLFTLFKIDYLEKLLEEEYKIRTEYDIEEGKIAFKKI